MIFPGRNERIKKDIALALTIIASLLLFAYKEIGSAGRSGPLAPTTGSTSLVTYTKSNYPDLNNIDDGAFVKLDYQEKEGNYTYFYDFCKEWRAGADVLEEADTKLRSDCLGYFGIIASADKNVVTCTLYTELGNTTLEGVQFRTYDDSKQEEIIVDENGSAKFSVKSLPNGPYALCVWFDYTLKDGTVKTINAWTTVYVSNGNAYFARYVHKSDDVTMKTWLATQRYCCDPNQQRMS